jgi:cysteinyl-tRNA synthetase
MSMKYLGESFDLHTGGIDNMFPHHENEIAQSEAATGKPFVRYWMHCGYLVVDGAKMSKSLGNFYTLRDLRQRGCTGRDVRYVLMSAHYRQPLNFTMAALDAARAALGRLDDFRERLGERGGSGPAARKMPPWIEEGAGRFRAALEDDLNVPEALSALFETVTAGNRALDAGQLTPADALAALDAFDDLDRVLGFLQKPEDLPGEEVAALAARRDAARTAKNWAEADALRAQLRAVGWEVRDTLRGPKLRKRRA